MARAFTPKVVTANDLLEGDVIYLTAAGGWTRVLEEAELIVDEAEAQLRLLEAQSQPQVAVGAYLADAQAGETGPEPTHFREEFRRTGPSNYRHGKQEAAANV
ncbi:DUF2849 domain-containing protein [Epibacterium sp. MM17-32]|jgi:hypothetical protein|uniref:DUF2849 domain-containing protein n=1 Tax=Epibacterium sp. MM17-32 TaxID=2917734 RepID=UPI001EF3DC91|nr:DUF2849 domain-containing protein [Epibacterium sp. MM17-32]MCG7629412.1 DUF2849 domain-containing protein [Epibacterium sp. MM17-32]